MRILLYGECKKRGSGAWCYADALRTAGHELVEVDPTEQLAAWTQHLFWRLWRRASSEMPARMRRRHGDWFQAQVAASAPQLVIVLKGLWLARDDIDAAKQIAARVVLVNHDDFFSSNRYNWSTVQHEALSSYDCVYVTRRVNVDELVAREIEARFFPFSYHPAIHRLVPSAAGETHPDVVFVGSYERNRAEALEHLLSRTSRRVSIYGEQWDKLRGRSPLRPAVQTRFISGDELCRVIGGAGCALGFLRKENRDEYTQRSVEIPACGGVLLAERTVEHSRMFKEGRDADFFDVNDPDELLAKVEKICGDSKYAATLRANGTAVVRTMGFTYMDRVQQLLSDTIGERN
jgi:spore maturation protein CgeB